MRKLDLAFGKNRWSKVWRNTSMTFDEICAFLKEPVRTSETMDEYRHMPHDEKSRIKDIRPFVCGRLKDGHRTYDSVEHRSMLSLDGDDMTVDFVQQYCDIMPYASCMYSTHSSTPEQPRCRILVPLTRDVTPHEFNALSRLFAAELGMDMFDPFSHRINQPMFKGSVPKDGEYLFIVTEKEWLDPDAFLQKYPDWEDASALPLVKNEKPKNYDPSRKQADPLTKDGIVGAFCRTYGIEDAIEAFLPDVYEPSVVDGRYDFIPGDGAAGVILYEDKFAYSHHATDPAGGRLLNAFDLVRLHRFPDADEQKSFHDMAEFAMRDAAVRGEYIGADFEQEPDIDQPAMSETDTDAWEEPLPLEDAELPEFPLDALPKALGDYAAAVGRSTQTPVDMAAVSVLTVVSACMRNLYKVEGKTDWMEPTNLYSVIIAEPSERKSAVVSMAVKPVNAFVKEHNEKHKVEFEMSKARKQKLENKKSSLLSQSRKKGEDKSAQDFDDDLRDVIERLVNFQEVKPLRIYVDDTTPEKLTETLSENNNAISIISTEGGIFDVLSGTYSNKVNIDVFLKAYSGESISVERIMRNSITVDEACLTILLSVQPVVIGELMGNKKFRHRGLTARFLYSFPRSFVGSRDLESEPIPENVYAAYRDLIYNILSEERENNAQIIRLTDDAKERLVSYYNSVEKRIGGEYSMYSDWLGKLVGNTLRIAGILARASVMKEDVLFAEDDPIEIDAAVMENAMRIGKYFLVHAVNAYGNMGVRADFKSTLMALDKIKQKGLKKVTRRDIMRMCGWIGSAEEAQTVLSALEDYGSIRLSSIDLSDKLRAGRPKNAVYTVNPRVYA